MVKVQEGEGQVVIDFEVYDQRPADSDVLIAAIEIHEQLTGRTPDMVAGDAGFYSAKNVATAKQMGVKRVSVPSRSTKSAALKREQKKRWFKKGQKWRTGCEGRIRFIEVGKAMAEHLAMLQRTVDQLGGGKAVDYAAVEAAIAEGASRTELAATEQC